MTSKKIQTESIRLQTARSQHREHAVPLYITSSFTFDSAEHGQALFADEVEGNIYTRFSNPNTTEFVEKMTVLEKMEDGFAFASGMAALFSTFAALLSSGDHVVASRALFGSTHQIFTRIFHKWGISHSYVDIENPDDWEKSITKNSRMLFVETPSNPGLDLVDMDRVAQLKEKYNLVLAVDNTFATPYLQTPADFGADLIIHSATKYIDGQGRVIGGVTVGKNEIIEDIRFFARQTGPSLSPFNAWLLSRSLETLAIRMDKTCTNAHGLARFLEQHDQVEQVKYPYLPSHPQFKLAKKQMRGGGGIISFTIKGGLERAMKFLNATEMASLTANLGDTRTIITHPATTTHSKLSPEEQARVGITPGLIRISTGLEDIEDIIADIARALERTS